VLTPGELRTLRADDLLLLDVRDGDELEAGTIPGARHIPLPELRARLTELPKERLIVAFCQSGQRSYMACRILTQHGYRCKNLAGAYKTWATTPRALSETAR
jgi:rhodanese-related sulfurtransferase